MTTTTSQSSKGILGTIERLGNKVPHPVIMFLYLILIVMVLSHVLYLFGVEVTDEIAVPIPSEVVPDFYEDTTEPSAGLPDEPFDTEYESVTQTIAIRSLLNTEGVRFIFSSFVANFAGFGVIAVTLIAMAGVGVAEHLGMMDTLIRKLVAVAPRSLFTIIIVFVGVVSSVATDAGYLILIPLAASAFLSLGRHPLAGMAAAFAGVSAVFGVNVLITPVDSMITEITNEAITLTGGTPITITANYYFSVASSIIMTLVVAFVTARIIEPRLGKYVRKDGAAVADDAPLSPAESKGLRYALIGVLIFMAYIVFITLPSGAPLRDPVTDAIIGTTPFMDSLIFIISLAFLIAGIGYGIGAGTLKNKNDVITGVTKTFSGLAGLIFMLLMISQFIAFFNFSNMPTVLAVSMAGLLEQANVGALPLLLGMIIVIVLLNVIIPGVVPKWAIFAPVFIPIFIRLDVAPQTVLAAYRIGDSPLNVITPLMVYLPFIVTVAQRYDKDAGLGTVVALMLPYAVVVAVAWILLFILWFVLGIPLGPGSPVSM
jgi:aminobenzoyl-glutamate transport protein